MTIEKIGTGSKKTLQTKSDKQMVSNLPLLKKVLAQKAVRGQRINLGFKKLAKEYHSHQIWTPEEEETILEDNTKLRPNTK